MFFKDLCDNWIPHWSCGCTRKHGYSESKLYQRPNEQRSTTENKKEGKNLILVLIIHQVDISLTFSIRPARQILEWIQLYFCLISMNIVWKCFAILPLVFQRIEWKKTKVQRTPELLHHHWEEISDSYWRLWVSWVPFKGTKNSSSQFSIVSWKTVLTYVVV